MHEENVLVRNSKVLVLRPSELSARQREAWTGFVQADPSLASPFFAPGYAESVAKLIPEVRVGILESGGEPVAFLPFELASGGLGKRLHWCDYQGLIARPGLKIDVLDFIRACGMRAWDFDHLLASQSCFASFHRDTAQSPVVDVSQGYEFYAAGRPEAGVKQIKEANLKLRRIERNVGKVDFRVHENSPAVLEQLLKWRWGRYPDVRHSFQTVLSALTDLMNTQTNDFKGVLTTLYANDILLAAHFGLQSRTVWHHWFPSYNPEFEKLSPGIVRDLKILQTAPEIGIKLIDFGNGDQQYKTNYMTGVIPLAVGSVDVSPTLRGARHMKRALRHYLKAHPTTSGYLRRGLGLLRKSKTAS